MRLSNGIVGFLVLSSSALGPLACTPDHARDEPDARLHYYADAGPADGAAADVQSADLVGPDTASVPDAGAPDSALPDLAAPDTAAPDSALADSASVDAGPPPLLRGDSCGELGPDRCASGLVCTPSGTCQELCDEQYCADNANFCFGSHPDHVCPDPTHSHCVEGEGALQLCRDINLDFTQAFCANGAGSYVWFYHSQNSLPDTCWEGPIEFTTAHICISAVIDTHLTHLGGDLTVITDDPGGYTDTSSCDYFAEIDLNGLRAIGGDLEVGDVSGTYQRSDLQVNFTRLELPALEAIYGRLHYADAPFVTHINAPALRQVGGFFVIEDLPAMETVYLPGLEVIGGGLRLTNLPSLTTLDLSHLRRIEGYVAVDNLPCLERSVIDAIAAKATGPVLIQRVGGGAGCP